MIVALEIPAPARAVSFGLDRVSLPMEEPRARPVGRPRKDAPKRPVQRVYRMAYRATITVHDETGAALQTIRQGAVPSVEPLELCDRLLADAVATLQQRPDLRVVLLSDGASEMRTLLRSPLDETTPGTKVYELLDFWHLVEKLAPAAQVVYGEGAGATVLHRWRTDLLERSRTINRRSDGSAHSRVSFLTNRATSGKFRNSVGRATLTA